MPSKTDLQAATWLGACVFMLLHVVGLALFGWSTAHPTWWVALAFLLGGLAVSALPEGADGH